MEERLAHERGSDGETKAILSPRDNRR